MATSFETEVVQDHLDALQESLDSLKIQLKEVLGGADTTLTQHVEKQSLDSIARAKLYVTVAYAIDSMLFCHLKTSGTKIESHTILHELARIKQYVSKIKEATAHQKKRAVQGLAATNRIIAHDLAHNAITDRERALQTQEKNKEIEERLRNASSIGKHTRFENSGIMKPATERLVPGEVAQDDVLKNQNDETTDVSMFDESKSEKKNRERRERKAARKERHKNQKVKQTARAAASE